MGLWHKPAISRDLEKAVAGMVTLANGTAERRASQIMLKAKAEETGGRITVGEDKAYDTADQS